MIVTRFSRYFGLGRLILMIVTRFSRYFGALFLSNSVTLCLVLVLSLGDRNLLAVLLRHRVTHFSGHLLFHLFLYGLALLLGVVLSDLLVVGGALIFVLSVAVLFGNIVALFSGNILAVLLRYILTVLLGHLLAHFLGLAVALGCWDHRSYSLLHILALGHWYWTTYWLQNCVTFFLIFIIPVWNFDSMALLSRLIPALFTWLIPALLLSMLNNTFSLSNSGAHLLSNSLALLFISVLGHLLLDNPTVVHVRQIIALFFILKLTLVLSYIISLSFSCLMTNLLMFSVAHFLIFSLTFLGVFCVAFLFVLSVTFFLIFSFTLLFSYFLTLLLWNRLSPGNLDSMALFSWLVVHLSVPDSIALLFILSGALFFIRSHFMWYLDCITFLSGFIPTLLFPDCITGRNTTVGATS